jgi:predicted nucleic acid-binding protein
MIYIDSSSLLKLFHDEPESASVRQLVAGETDVIISSLTQLESRIQIKSAWLGGDYGKPRYLAFIKQLDDLPESAPFRFVELAGNIFPTAIRQDWEAGPLHLRVLDRLHLAAMQELNALRLMTNDENQATAAKALGFEVIIPR